ncbi:MAG: hypothetical protein WA672_02220 [Candidatus Angelobacter sp.]
MVTKVFYKIVRMLQAQSIVAEGLPGCGYLRLPPKHGVRSGYAHNWPEYPLPVIELNGLVKRLG